jgi:hypothetical protein
MDVGDKKDTKEKMKARRGRRRRRTKRKIRIKIESLKKWNQKEEGTWRKKKD